MFYNNNSSLALTCVGRNSREQIPSTISFFSFSCLIAAFLYPSVFPFFIHPFKLMSNVASSRPQRCSLSSTCKSLHVHLSPFLPGTSAKLLCNSVTATIHAFCSSLFEFFKLFNILYHSSSSRVEYSRSISGIALITEALD